MYKRKKILNQHYELAKCVIILYPLNHSYDKQLLFQTFSCLFMSGCYCSRAFLCEVCYSNFQDCSDVVVFSCRFRDDVAFGFHFLLDMTCFYPKRSVWVKNIRLRWRAAYVNVCLFLCVRTPVLPITHLRETHPISLISIDDTAGYIQSDNLLWSAADMTQEG